MNYNFTLSIPKNTVESDPSETVMKMTYGVIRKVIIVVPRGPAAVAHLKILYHEHQLYPLNVQGNYKGDGVTVQFEEYQPIIVAPYELKAKGWNESTAHAHEFMMNFTVLRPEEMGMKIPSQSIRALQELLGVEIEL